MEYTLKDKYALIRREVMKSDSKDPVEIARSVMNKDFVSMHGPEHHVMVGSALLTAYKNAGGDIDLPKALSEMQARGKKVPDQL